MILPAAGGSVEISSIFDLRKPLAKHGQRVRCRAKGFADWQLRVPNPSEDGEVNGQKNEMHRGAVEPDGWRRGGGGRRPSGAHKAPKLLLQTEAGGEGRLVHGRSRQTVGKRKARGRRQVRRRPHLVAVVDSSLPCQLHPRQHRWTAQVPPFLGRTYLPFLAFKRRKRA